MHSTRRLVSQSAISLAATAPLIALAGGTAAADEPPKGMPAVVSDVLQPSDPEFWNPGIQGTRILTPLDDGDEVACSAGFQPPISCSTLNSRDSSRAQRVLEHVDVPVPGAAPIRVWVDLPRWGDGSTAALNERIVSGNFGS